MSATREDTLLGRIARGDQGAVRSCVERYGSLVWSLALRMTDNRHEAEDAVQEVFIDLWRNAHRYDPAISSEPTFVTLLARRRMIDRRRRAVRQPDLTPLPELPASHPGGYEEVETKDEACRARQAMDQLPAGQKLALQLTIYQGMTHEQISRQLQIPLGTVKANVRRGLIRLREILEDSPPPRLPSNRSNP